MMKDAVMSTDTLSSLLLARAAGVGGARVAVYQRRLGVWEPTSWAELAAAAERIGNGLAAKGVVAGDVVALIGDDSVELLAAEHGVIGLGAVALLVPPDYSPVTTAALLLEHRAKAAITADQEQFDKCVDAPTPPDIVVVIDTRGLRGLEMAGRSDRASRATLAQLIDDAGAVSSWRASAESRAMNDRTLLVASASGPDVVVHAVTNGALCAAGSSAAQALRIDARSRLLLQRSLAELDDQVVHVAAPAAVGAAITIGEGGLLASAEIAQVAPSHLRSSPKWLGTVTADASRRATETRGIKRLALRGALPSADPSATASHVPLLAPGRIVGLMTGLVGLAFLLLTTSMNDWLRLLLCTLIAAVGGLVYMRTPNAVSGAIRRRYGLGRCGTVIAGAEELSADGRRLLGGLGIAVAAPSNVEATVVGRIPSSILHARQGSRA